MKFRLLLFNAFCLLTLQLSAQVVDVATGVNQPVGIAKKGNEIYISEYGSGKVSVIDITQPLPTSPMDVVGSLIQPTGLLVTGDELYISVEGSNKVVKINTTVMNPPLVDVVTNIASPEGLFLEGNELYIGQFLSGGIRKIDITEAFPPAVTSVVAGYDAAGLIIAGNNLYFSDLNSTIYKIDIQTGSSPEAVVSGLAQPAGLTLNGNFLYISEFGGGKISRIDLNESNPTPETVASGLSQPTLVVFDGIDLFFGQLGLNKISKIQIAAPSFSSLSPVCSNAMPDNLGGASPTGGVYSGPGVTDNGDGETFTFDPVTAGGVGMYTVTYTAINGQTASANIEVVPSPSLTSSSTPNTGANDGTATVNASGGASPYTYAWSNGATTATITGLADGTYDATVTDANGCTAATSIEVLLAGDACADAFDINNLFGQPFDEPQTSGIYDNTDYTTENDPAEGWECFGEPNGNGSAPSLERTIWYSFTGDGTTYKITTVPCNATNYITEGDTQIAVYSGNCSDPAPVTCNEDDPDATDFRAAVEVATESGVEYLVMIDGFGPDFEAFGEFCIEVTRLSICPVDLVLTTQAEVDAFPADYPGCTEIEGNLTIGASTDIDDLTPLAQIVSIGGNLQLFGNNALISLSGLDSLTSVGGDVDIQINPGLTSISGLEKLTTIGGKLLIAGHPNLASLAGLSGLIATGDGLLLIQNHALTDLSGLDNITSIGDGGLNIEQNDALTSLSGIDNIDHNSIADLRLVSSANLATCNVASICDYLEFPANPANITGNAQGCADRQEVEAACIVNVKEELLRTVSLFPNPTRGTVEITGLENDGILTVFNYTGRMIRQEALAAPGAQLDLSGMPAGMYLLHIATANGVATSRVVKE